MAVQRMTYLLDSVPDPAYPLYRFRAGGDVRSALRDDAGHLLRTFAAFPPGSASLSLQLYYRPASAGENHGVQRLSVSLSGQAFSPAAAASLKLLLASGPLQRFYRLVPGDPVITPELPAACSVVRRQELLPATVTAEFNAKALSVYYAATPFKAREENDYMLLDGVLDPLSEPALVTIDISPAAIGPEAAAHTRYLSLLQQVNHVFSLGDDDLFAPGGGEWRDAARPLHVREPLVDELLQQQRRFHETLRQPHLRFGITDNGSKQLCKVEALRRSTPIPPVHRGWPTCTPQQRRCSPRKGTRAKSIPTCAPLSKCGWVCSPGLPSAAPSGAGRASRPSMNCYPATPYSNSPACRGSRGAS